ncbi:MAG: energy-coupling factor ABC transporter permease, partial [Methanomicrobiales archaeon]|nr:energy-coupling factor ABC transporter permease [Methanomicrobiales archaeon]
GFLPGPWWQIWFAVSLVFIAYGMYRLKRLTAEDRQMLPLLAVAGAFIFVLSSLKLPSVVTGSSSHPTGTGLAGVLFGPAVTSLLALIVLLYQAIFLAHGGLTTLGANVFSMGIAGPYVAWLVYRAGSRIRLNAVALMFVAAVSADLTTYLVTSVQLALAFPAAAGGVTASFLAFGTIFAITQIPLALMEGAVTSLIFKYIITMRGDILVRLRVMPEATMRRLQKAMQ